MAEPAWWPLVVAATGRRRYVAGRLLAHATPHYDHGVLRLAFTSPDIERAWVESGAQDALEGALHTCRIDVQVEVAAVQEV